MSIEREVQKLTTDNLVTLYELDTTPIGGATKFRFTKSSGSSGNVQWNGQTWVAIDLEATGFSWDGSGSFPRPKLQVSNVSGLLSSALIDLKDLVGATLTRIRTFEQFLDTGSDPDPSQVFPLEIYTVEQKSNHNKTFIEWTLSAIVDQSGRMLPGRLILRDVCSFKYRVYDADTDTFLTNNATCPYGVSDPGPNYFNENDVATTKANDMCSKRVSGCRKRYGAKGILPFGGFPGVQRKRSA